MNMIIALCLVAMAVAAPPSYYPEDNKELINYENDNDGLGDYKYYFAQRDGTNAQQTGQLRNEGLEDEHVAVSGSFSWIGPDGVTYTVKYTADEEGYKPEIEQGPGGGVPPAVVASLLG